MKSDLNAAIQDWMREFDRTLSVKGRRRQRIDSELKDHFEDLLTHLEGQPADYSAAMVEEACCDPAKAAERFDRQAQGATAVSALRATVAAFVLLAGVWMSALLFFPRSPWPNDKPPASVARWLTPGYLAWWLGLTLIVALVAVVRRRLLSQRHISRRSLRLVAAATAVALVVHVVFGAAFAFARDADVSASTHATTVAMLTSARVVVALAAAGLIARAVTALNAHAI